MSTICPSDLNAIRERYCKKPKLNYYVRDVMETMDLLCREVQELRYHLDEAHKHIRLLTEERDQLVNRERDASDVRKWWADAMAHCSPEVKAQWTEALKERGVVV